MRKLKTKKRPNWENNKTSKLKAFWDCPHTLTAINIAHKLEPLCIKNGTIGYSEQTLTFVMNRCNALFPDVNFTKGSVTTYCNAFVNDKFLMGLKKQTRWASPTFRPELYKVRNLLKASI
jgi:hypothetical protein